MSDINVETIVHKLRNDFLANGICTKECDTDVIAFKTKFPKLFEMVTSNSCEDSMLHTLLSAYKNVKTGNVTQEDGDKAFGEVAAARYVYPLVNEPTSKM